jgi:hypothetical protein
VLLLSGCGTTPVVTLPIEETPPGVAPDSSPTLDARPTEAPTAEPTSAPTAEPTAEPQPSGLLPAPLIYNERGQLYRLGVDGASTIKLTDEQPPEPNGVAVTEFDVSPVDGSLVYVVQQISPENQTHQLLIRTGADGKDRRVLLEGVFVTTPRFSPDGAQIAFGVYPDLLNPNPRLAGGVYVMPSTGGTPQLVQVNDPFDPASSDGSARAYSPSSWSPDGKRLLLQAFLPASELCETVLKELGRDGVIKPTAPEGTQTSCRSAAWSDDGQTAYIPLGEPGPFGAFAGLAEVDAMSGALSVVIGKQVDGRYIALNNGLSLQPDGSMLGFVATSPTPFPSEPQQQQPHFTLHAIAPDGQLTPLRGDSQVIWGPALWAADASGSVIPTDGDTTPRQALVWVPADERPAVELVAGELMGSPRWGR